MIVFFYQRWLGLIIFVVFATVGLPRFRFRTPGALFAFVGVGIGFGIGGFLAAFAGLATFGAIAGFLLFGFG